MDKDLLIDFVVANFMVDGNFDANIIADFIDLSKDDQVIRIKLWANDRIIKLTSEKASLEKKKLDTEAIIDSKLIVLNDVVK